jgi:hypothetical protein
VSNAKPRLSFLRFDLALRRRKDRVDSPPLRMEAPYESGNLQGARLVSFPPGLSNDYVGDSISHAVTHQTLSLSSPKVPTDAQVLDAYRAFGGDVPPGEISDRLDSIWLLSLALSKSEYWLALAPDGCIYGRDENGRWLMVNDPWRKPLRVHDLKKLVICRLSL